MTDSPPKTNSVSTMAIGILAFMNLDEMIAAVFMIGAIGVLFGVGTESIRNK